MALDKSLAEMRASVRKLADVQGTTALLRHPDADLNDYINRGLGSVHRRLTAALPDQRFLASTTITTSKGVSTYGLPVAFDFLISIEFTADGRRRWISSYEMIERAALLSPDEPSDGIPLCYRLRGGNIEFLPTPGDVYSILVWYVPSAPQLTTDAQLWDTISRLDEYVIAYASRRVATKDKNWDLRDECVQVMTELEGEIAVLARNRDRNSPPRILDVRARDRWGRSGGAR